MQAFDLSVRKATLYLLSKISLYEYIEKMLAKLLSDINGTTKTPAVVHIFNVNPQVNKLPEEKAQLFHHLVVKLFYLCRCKQQDIQTAIALLCTRVQTPDEEEYKNSQS